MMIMRFHKLIQSRVLWLVFLGILVCTFVLWGVAGNTDSGNEALAHLKEPYARVNGRTVTRLEFRRHITLLQRNQRVPDDQVEEMALTRLALLDYAREMGIDVPRETARAEFMRNFANDQGVVDQEAYGNFRRSLQGDLLTEQHFVDFVRDELVLQQLLAALSTYALVPSYSAERFGGPRSDMIDLQYARLNPELLTEEVTVDDERLTSYFESSIEQYRLPEMRTVRYLTVSAERFQDEVAPVTDEEARTVYNSQPERYTRTVEVPAEEEGGEPTTRREPIPFDEAKEEIRRELSREKALRLASEKAMDIAVRLTPSRGQPGASMEAVAEEMDLEILEAGPFSRRSRLEEIDSPGAFIQAAFELDTTDFGRISSPVTSGDAILVLELTDITPARLPELAEVEDRVRAGATNFYQRAALATLATNLVEEIRAEIGGGTTFETAATARDLAVISPEPFRMRDLNPRMPEVPSTLVEAAASQAAGDVFGPVRHPFFGTQMIGYLEGRTPSPEILAEEVPRLQNMLASQLVFPGVFERLDENILQPRIELVGEAANPDDETETGTGQS